MKTYDNEYIERKVAQVEKEVYGGSMPAANKSVLRQMIKADEDYAAREEVENSNSVVGDHFNQRTY